MTKDDVMKIMGDLFQSGGKVTPSVRTIVIGSYIVSFQMPTTKQEYEDLYDAIRDVYISACGEQVQKYLKHVGRLQDKMAHITLHTLADVNRRADVKKEISHYKKLIKRIQKNCSEQEKFVNPDAKEAIKRAHIIATHKDKFLENVVYKEDTKLIKRRK